MSRTSLKEKPNSLLAGYLSPDELAAELEVCTKTLDRWRVFDEGPPVTKIGRKTYYSRSGVAEWLREREQQVSPRKRVA
jgi:Helix-turn-helix domain